MSTRMPNTYILSTSKKLLFLLFIGVLLLYSVTVVSAQTITLEPTVAPTVATPSSSSAPKGQVIQLDFGVPGIGTESGNLSPKHPTRDVFIAFYSPDKNTSDPSIKPKTVFRTRVTFDSDPASSTYGNFVNKSIDLADKVPNGKYQILFKTTPALQLLVKEKDNDIGGKLFGVSKSYNPVIKISAKNVITGDIYPIPDGDNSMDINDYNSLVGCFGPKSDSKTCPDKNAPDLNDDGMVDGTDYNIMLGNFKTLLSMGLPVPSLDQDKRASKKSITKPKPTKSVAANDEKKVLTKGKSSGAGAVIFFIVIIVILIAGGVFLIIKKRKKVPAGDNTINENIEKSNNMPSQDKEIDKEFYVKQQTVDEANKTTVLTLTDDTGPTLGYYKGGEVKEGFAKVKGIMKKDGSKVFIEVSEIIPEEESPS